MKKLTMMFAVFASTFSACGGETTLFVGTVTRTITAPGGRPYKVEDTGHTAMAYTAPNYVTVSGLDNDALIFDRNRDQLALDTTSTDTTYTSPSFDEKCDFTAGTGILSGTTLSVDATETCEGEDHKLGEKTVLTINIHFTGYTR